MPPAFRRSRVLWTLTDQAASSFSNFVFVAVVARTAGVDEFGGFALVYLLYAVVLGAGRASGGEILLLRATERPGSVRADGARLLGFQLILGLIAAAAVALGSIVADAPLAGPMRALAVVLPGLAAQDAMRYFFFASREPKRALVNDILWAALQVTAFVAVLLGPFSASPAQLTLAWGLSAAVAAVVAMRLARLAPVRPRGWLTKDFSRVGSFLADFALLVGAFYLSIYLVGAVAGLAAVAGIRGAQVLFGPFESLLAGVRVWVLPALGEAAANGRQAIRSEAGRIAVALGLLGALWGAPVLLLPRSVGVEILGDSWDRAHSLLPLLVLIYVARAVSAPALDGVRALGGGPRLVWLRASTAVLTLAGLVLGGLAGDARGATTGWAAAFIVSVVLWWVGFMRGSESLTSAVPR